MATGASGWEVVAPSAGISNTLQGAELASTKGGAGFHGFRPVGIGEPLGDRDDVERVRTPAL